MSSRSPLAKRKFTISVLPNPAPSPALSRHLKRIHVAAEILKAAKICAGDALVLRLWEPEEEEGQLGIETQLKAVSLDEQKAKVSPEDGEARRILHGLS